MITEIRTRFPAEEERVKELVEQHLELDDEPLLLAIYYAPPREPDDIFLFEVIENFGRGGIDEDRELFEVSYGSTEGFPMDKGQSLHLIMTNPRELEVSLRENWTLAAEIRDAVRASQARVLFEDPKFHFLMEMLRG